MLRTQWNTAVEQCVFSISIAWESDWRGVWWVQCLSHQMQHLIMTTCVINMYTTRIYICVLILYRISTGRLKIAIVQNWQRCQGVLASTILQECTFMQSSRLLSTTGCSQMVVPDRPAKAWCLYAAQHLYGSKKVYYCNGIIPHAQSALGTCWQ